jgi:iron uptake system EfeUOB component EfeO/EfeM
MRVPTRRRAALAPPRIARRHLRLLQVGLPVLAGVAVWVGVGMAAAGGAHPIVVTSSACAPGWTAPRSGRTVFQVANRSASSIYEVDLVGANGASVYGEIEMLAPGTELPLDVVLPPGAYSFQCQAFSGVTLLSRVERVEGPKVFGSRPFTPVTSGQIQLATLAYRAAISRVMQRLISDTGRLTDAVEAGRLASGRRLWLPAHLDYERLGAVYDTFGSFNQEINGRPLGLVGGVESPDFQGFLRLEYGLWHGQSASELEPVARRLDAAVRALVHRFPQMLRPTTSRCGHTRSSRTPCSSSSPARPTRAATRTSQRPGPTFRGPRSR